MYFPISIPFDNEYPAILNSWYLLTVSVLDVDVIIAGSDEEDDFDISQIKPPYSNCTHLILHNKNELNGELLDWTRMVKQIRELRTYLGEIQTNLNNASTELVDMDKGFWKVCIASESSVFFVRIELESDISWQISHLPHQLRVTCT